MIDLDLEGGASEPLGMTREEVIEKIKSMKIKGECFTDVTKEEFKDERGSQILREILDVDDYIPCQTTFFQDKNLLFGK